MSRVAPPRIRLTRRTLLRSAGAFGGTLLAGGADGLLGSRTAKAQSSAVPAVVTSDNQRPQIPYGVMSGDPAGGRVILWSKTDRPARMLVEVATREDFRDARRVAGRPRCRPRTSPPGSISAGCRPGPTSSTASLFQDLADLKMIERAGGRAAAHRAGGARRTITFAWSGDEAGQGWGINPGWGGYRSCTRRCAGTRPDFFIHSGDQIYADGPITAEVKLDDGTRLEEPDHAGQGEGRRDARRVPRQLRLQPARREQAPLRRRGAVPGAVGRPRDAQQLVSGPDPGRRALHGARAPRCWPPAPGGRCSNTTRCGSTRSIPSGSIARFAYGPLARGLHARRAQLSRAELAEPADRARRRRGLPRARSSCAG